MKEKHLGTVIMNDKMNKETLRYSFQGIRTKALDLAGQRGIIVRD